MGGPVEDFLRAHLTAHPEDAWTLGMAGAAGTLPAPTPEAAHDEVVRCVTACEAIAKEPDEDLDRDAVLRVAAFHLRYGTGDRDAENLELAALPNAMLQHGALHAKDDAGWDAVATRAAGVPAFLAQHAENLRRGAKDGRAPDAGVVRTFVERILPGAADAVAGLPFAARAKKRSSALVTRLSEAARAASDAYRAFAVVVAEEVAPAARDDVVLGEEEVGFRLAEVMGVITPIDELRAIARDELARARRSLDHAALMRVLAARPASLDEALAAYRRWIVEATNFVRDRELVPVPAGMAQNRDHNRARNLQWW